MAMIKVNGRLRFFDHVEALRRVSKSRWVATRHGVEYQIEGGKHAGGTSRDWWVDGANWSGSIDCTSLMDAMRLLDTM